MESLPQLCAGGGGMRGDFWESGIHTTGAG